MNENKPVIDIWGACVSREIFNFTTDFKVGYHILQNPIQTLFGEPWPIEDDQILATSNFTRRMAKLNFYKQAVPYFQENFKAKYLMIDTYDCRSNILCINGLEKYCICNSLTTKPTLNALKSQKIIDYTIKSPQTISDEEWENLVQRFIAIIRGKYDEENIIINDFLYAQQYVDENNVFKTFDHLDEYSKDRELTHKVTNLFIKALPKAKVLLSKDEPIGNANHKLGLFPVHYTDDYYRNLAQQLKEML